VNELVNMCVSDPSLTNRLVSYVNGSGFGLNRRIATVAHAVSLLGIRGTRNLALAICVTDMAPRGPDGDAVLAVCLRRAVAAKLLAEKLGRQNADDYFTLGLLMDVGLIVKARGDARAAVELARSAAAGRVTFERAAGQEEHTKLAARLARSWVVEDEMTAALLHHHEKEPVRTPFGIAAWLTEQLAGVFESSDVLQARLTAVEAGAAVGVSGADIDLLLQRIPAALIEVATFFDRDVGPQPDIETTLRDANGAINELNRSYHEVMSNLQAVLQEKEKLAAELKQASEELSTLALTDRLTGLANNRAFQESLARDMARADRQAAAISVLVLDLDDLKRFNELYGQATGDAALKAVSEVLVQATRVSDLLARIGGDEFALILPNTDVQGAKIVADRIRSNVEQRDIEGPKKGSLRVSVSVGLAMTKGPGCRGREQAMFDAAAQALLMAKQAGKNRVQVGSL
jgi:diguanylate cyclase (GGDEF)-like protein